MGIRHFAHGDIEIDFYHEDEITEFRYSSDSNKLDNFPKGLAETLASTLATDICVEIYFDDNDVPTHMELEECDEDLDDEESEEGEDTVVQ